MANSNFLSAEYGPQQSNWLFRPFKGSMSLPPLAFFLLYIPLLYSQEYDAHLRNIIPYLIRSEAASESEFAPSIQNEEIENDGRFAIEIDANYFDNVKSLAEKSGFEIEKKVLFDLSI
ncbi:unnamed protein product [Cylicostephanus goldi]|uniref:Uncharacterized protein n=1 Tax=Cylicostephanus goldi TaxID=71465 RepID=A0A3P6TIJ1_CYLGO|nr:unnamed protein product [Cylicostephanus goldi]